MLGKIRQEFEVKCRKIVVAESIPSGYISYANRTEIQQPTLNDLAGKWIVPVREAELAVKYCITAVGMGLVQQTKHTIQSPYLCFFYLNCDDVKRHKDIISYFLCENMIPRTRLGLLCNRGYKLDIQTQNNEYSKDSTLLHLSDFIDLNTGKGLTYSCLTPEDRDDKLREMCQEKLFNYIVAKKAEQYWQGRKDKGLND